MNIVQKHVDSNPSLVVLVKTKNLVSLKQQGKVAPSYFIGGFKTEDDNLYFLTPMGIFCMTTGQLYTETSILVKNWVVVSATLQKYPVDWMGIELKGLRYFL